MADETNDHYTIKDLLHIEFQNTVYKLFTPNSLLIILENHLDPVFVDLIHSRDVNCLLKLGGQTVHNASVATARRPLLFMWMWGHVHTKFWHLP